MVDIKPTMSTITLYVNGLNAPIKEKDSHIVWYPLKEGSKNKLYKWNYLQTETDSQT